MTRIVDAMSRLNGFISGKRDMSRKSATLGIALATVALAALPALAADYSVPDVDVDYNVADGVDVETGFEVDVKGIGYAITSALAKTTRMRPTSTSTTQRRSMLLISAPRWTCLRL